MKANSKRILCVDDDIPTLELRKAVLESSGYRVLTATCAEEALRMLGEGLEADLVVLDYMMPGMNGDEFAGILRQRYPGLLLVAVSAVGQLPSTLVNFVDSHAQKGQDPEAFLAMIAAVLDRSSGQSKAEQSSKTVLCVDDEQLQLQLRKLMLEAAGFAVLQARDATAAREIFRTRHVDAVVMDYWLSGANGTALAEEMKRLRPRIPIVMLSGFSSLPGEGVIVDAWLRKADIEPEDLVNEVRRLIDLRTSIPRTDE